MLKVKHYIVDQNPIGKGSFGKVYRAYDPIGKKNVAIKQTNIKRGEREADIMKQVGSSTFIPELYDFFIIDNHAYIVFEYIDGNKLGYTFNTRRKRYKEKISEKMSVEITINILKGIDRLHCAGFTHNDVMPKNIMIKNDKPKTVKVIDFNRGKEIKDTDSIQKDIRNAARICIFLMNGTAPKEMVGSEIENKKLRLVLMKALNPTAEERYQSAQEFIHALRPFA